MMKMLLCCLILIFVHTVTSQNHCVINQSTLSEKINNILDAPMLSRTTFGISLLQKNLDSYHPVFSKNQRSLLIPASNNKLLTTAAAFFHFGKNHFLETALYENSLGDFCLIGSGDASVTSQDLAQFAESIAIKVSGQAEIAQIFYDEVFPEFPNEWEWDDLMFDYGAEPTSFVVDSNVLEVLVYEDEGFVKYEVKGYDQGCISVVNQVVVGSKTSVRAGYQRGSEELVLIGTIGTGERVNIVRAVNRPVERYFCVLKKMLGEKGVTVQKFTRSSCDRSVYSKKVTSFSSPNFTVTMNHTMQVSDNLYAENFLRILGHDSKLSEDAQRAGLVRVREILGDAGVNTEAFSQHDGSGLSRHNLVSNEALTELLISLEKHPDFETYKSFLPTAGRSGTLKNRFIGTIGEGKIHAKTGTVEGCNSLSGYIDYGPGFIFSILSNGATAPASSIRNQIDTILLTLMHLCQ